MITRSPNPDAGAVYSDCERYRYRLWRAWRNLVPRPGFVLWVMLNPSTATELVLDPTLRRVDRFSRAWGMADRWEVANLFALRSTEPAALHHEADPVGADNDAVLAQLLADAALIVVGWGAFPMAVARAQRLVQLAAGRPLVCLGTTKAGWPKHPLYLRGDATLQPWSMPS